MSVCVRKMPKRDLNINVVSAAGSSVPGSSVPGSSARIKNTRRRIQQKRTRNRSGGGGGGGGGGRGGGGGARHNESKPNNPVIESSNPFFIAVCSPESYKPVETPINHRMGGRRDESRTPVTRTRPNVFLRQPYRNSSTCVSGSGHTSYPNQFIHNPRLQNERQRDSSSAMATATDPVAMCRNATVTGVVTNINDTVQFPSLSSASSASSASQTSKLNFKEMVLKNKNSEPSVAAAVAAASVPVPVTAAYVPVPVANNVRQRPLSSGNIFSSAFYGLPSEPLDDVNDDAHNYNNDTTSRSVGVISSVLVDSCDRKYDNLYK